MQVIVKGHHIHVSDALRASTQAKVEKLGRFFDRIHKVEVEFAHEKTARSAVRNRVDVVVSTPLGIVTAHAKGPQPERALDGVIEKVERQIKKLKEKIVHHGAPKGGARAKAISPRLGRTTPAPLEPFFSNGEVKSSPADAGDPEAETGHGAEADALR